jgi:hypothetical protein
MTPLPTDIVAKDVTQWLSEGWFYAELSPNVFHIVRLLTANADENKAYVEPLYEDHDKDLEEIVCEFKQLYAYWPECGALNIMPNPDKGVEGKFAVHLSRLQKKQWKRTYNAYCLKLRTISTKPADFSITADYAQVVYSAFNPQHFTYTEALSMFEDGWRSVAINPILIVSRINDKEQMLYSDGEIIGVIKKDKLTCFNPALKRRLLYHFDNLVE